MLSYQKNYFKTVNCNCLGWVS